LGRELISPQGKNLYGIGGAAISGYQSKKSLSTETYQATNVPF
jgi:hypothetical protein